MNSIVRSLLISVAIGSLAIILICASDDAEADSVDVYFEDGINVITIDISGGLPYTEILLDSSPSSVSDTL